MGGQFGITLRRVVGAALLIFAPYVPYGYIWAFYGAALSVDANRREAAYRARKSRDAFNASLEDRKVVLRSSVAPLQIAYGRALVGGVLVYGESTGVYNEALHLVIALHPGHEIDAIEEIYIGDVPLGTLDGNGWVTTGRFVKSFASQQITVIVNPTGSTNQVVDLLTYMNSSIQNLVSYFGVSNPLATLTVNSVEGATYAGVPNTTDTSNQISVPVVGFSGGTVTLNTSGVAQPVTLVATVTGYSSLVRARKYLGTSTDIADPVLVAASAGKWTAAHRGRGRPKVVLTLYYNEDAYAGLSVDQVRCLIRAKKCFDPRNGTTVWTQNPALQVRDYMLDKLGFGAASSEMNDTKLAAAANICDETVAIYNQKRAALYETFNNGLNGWTTQGATATVADSKLSLVSTTNDTAISKTGLSITGTTYRTVVARVRKIAGTSWQGDVYYSTAGHGFGTAGPTFYKRVAEPVWDAGGWAIIEWDMASLTNGGTDWTANTITGVRIDLGNSATDSYQIDWIAVGAEDNQARYRGDGMISTESERLGNLSVLLSAMAGFWTYCQGQFHVYAGGARTSSLTLDEHSVTAKEQFNVKADTDYRDLFNAVHGTFVDPDNNWEPNDYPEVTNPLYVAEDNNESLPLDLPLPMTIDPTMAQRLAKISLEIHRQSVSVHGGFNLLAYKAVPGDVVTLNLARYGFVNKDFLVVDRRFSLEKLVTLDLREESPASYDWNKGAVTLVDPAPNTVLPAPNLVPTLGTISAVCNDSTALRLSDGTVIPRLLVSWSAPTDIRVLGGSIEVQLIRQSGEWETQPLLAGTVTSVYLYPLVAGEKYRARVRARNAAGVWGGYTQSAWVTAVNITTVPAPTGLSLVIVGAGQRRFTVFMSAKPPRLKCFEIRYQSGSSINWATATILANVPDTNPSNLAWVIDTVLPAPGTWSFEVRSIDFSGTYSSTGAQLLNQTISTTAGTPPDGTVSFGKTPAPLYIGGIITPDPAIEDTTAWFVEFGAPSRVLLSSIPGASNNGRIGRYAWKNTGGRDFIFTKPVPIGSGRVYRAYGSLFVPVGSTAFCYLVVYFYREDLTRIPGGGEAGSDGQNWPATGTWHYFFNGVPTPGQWNDFSLLFGPNNAAGRPGIPTEARFLSVGALLQNTGAGDAYANGLYVVDASTTELIPPDAVSKVYAPTDPSPGGVAGYDTAIGGTNRLTHDKEVNTGTIDMKAGESLVAQASLAGSADYQNVSSRSSTRVEIDLVVSGSGKTAFAQSAAARTGNLKSWEYDTPTSTGSTPQAAISGEFVYTAPVDQTVTVYAGGGLIVGLGNTSSATLYLSVKHLKR